MSIWKIVRFAKVNDLNKWTLYNNKYSLYVLMKDKRMIWAYTKCSNLLILDLISFSYYAS